MIATTLTSLFLVYSELYGLPIGLLQAICTVESNLDEDAINLNDGGWGNHSLGICQVGYKTAVSIGLSPDRRNCTSSSIARLSKCKLLDVETNINYAAKYLAGQLDRYKGDRNKAISAYNAGSYSTRNKAYVRKVLKQLNARHRD